MFGAATLEERLKLAREIAARTKPRFVTDNSKQEAKQMRCTTPVTQDTKADRIELKNLPKAAVTELEEAETPKRAATFGSVTR